MGSTASKAKWKKRLLRLFGNRNGHGETPGVLARAEFHRALHQERSRADRTALPLSLVVVRDSLGPAPQSTDTDGRRALAELAKFITGRVRCTDIVGWFGKDKLGVLLPHTPGPEAWKLVDDVHSRFDGHVGNGDQSEHIDCRVYTYPLADGAGASDRRQLSLFPGPVAVDPAEPAEGPGEAQSEKGALQ